MTLQEGYMLKGRYRVKDQLGRGGMGAVYRAIDTLYDKPCAVKEFRLGYLPTEEETRLRGDVDATRAHSDSSHPQLVTREQAIRQFRTEAMVLAKLEHPNLPKVTDFFDARDNYYLVMTLIEGSNLAAIMKEARRKPLPEATVMGWMNQMMDALSYCHEQGVIHRDVKPANIILTSEGKVYLVDFGIAKPDPESETGLSSFTSGYSPLEQYGDKGGTDTRSDIYALGATMYALLTGTEPAEAHNRVTDKDIPAPRSVVNNISPSTDAAVLRAMAIKPDDRFQSVAKMRAALDDSPAILKRRWFFWAAAAVLALILALVGLWWFLGYGTRGTPVGTPLAETDSASPTPFEGTSAAGAAQLFTPTGIPSPTAEALPTRTLEPAPTPWLEVLASLDVRPGPGLEYDPPFGTLSPGADLAIMGRSSDGNWLKICCIEGFTEGWVLSSPEYVSSTVSLDSLPTVPPPPAMPLPASTTPEPVEETPTHTPSPFPTSTTAPTPSPMPSPRPTPTRTPRPSAPPAQSPAPSLRAPADGSVFSENDEITLSWSPVGPLSAEVYFEITVAYLHRGETWYDEAPWTKETRWTLSDHAYLLDLSDDGEFRWSVRVMQKTGVDTKERPVGDPLSPMSDEWTLIWRRSGGGGPGATPTKEIPP